MAQRAGAESPEPDVAQVRVGKAVGEHAGAAARDGVDPASPEALQMVERIEGIATGDLDDRATRAERIEAFADRRVARYWTLVGIVNGWPRSDGPTHDELIDAWEWYARALAAHE